MTPDQFLVECRRYFGAWPVDKPGIAAAVAGYVKTKRHDFLAALWPLVRDSRPAGYGPPDMAALIAQADRAADIVRTHTPPARMIEDGDAPATPEEISEALAPVVKKVEEQKAETSESGYYRLKRPKPFKHLEGLAEKEGNG